MNFKLFQAFFVMGCNCNKYDYREKRFKFERYSNVVFQATHIRVNKVFIQKSFSLLYKF